MKQPPIRPSENVAPLQPLDYATPVRREPIAGMLVAQGLILATGVAGAMFILCLVVPRFAMVFSDFKLSLPTATVTLLAISRFFTQYYGWTLLVPIPVVVPALTAAMVGQGGRPVRRRWVILVTWLFVSLLLGLLALLVVAGLFLPMMSLMGAVSSGSSR